MTCDECRDLMLEVARHRAAPFVEQSVRDHADGCTDCDAALARQLALTAGLRALALAARGASPASTETGEAPGWPGATTGNIGQYSKEEQRGQRGCIAGRMPPDVHHGLLAQQQAPNPAVLEARLVAAFTSRHAQPPVTRRSVAALPAWLPRVAAAVVLSAGAAAWWLATPARVTDAPSSVARVESSSAPVAAPIPVASQPERRGEVSRARPVRAGLPTARGAAPSPEGHFEPAGFTAIPAAAGLPDFESGEIVRLGIDVTALPSYGIEIPAGAQSAVQADLLIGQDGQARAIRLVNANLEDTRPRR